MAHTFVNPTMVAREVLRQLENNCVMGKLVFRGYEDEWLKNPNGWKIGDTVTVKAPVYFRVKDGATLDAVDLNERSTTFQIAYRKHIAWAVTAQQMSLNIDKLNERFIKPAAQALANYIDLILLGLYTDIPNQVGTPGTTPSDWYTIAEAAAKMDDAACPLDDRHCILDPWAQAKLADQLKGLLHQGMVEKAIQKGKFGDLAGFHMYMSQNVNTHTCGSGVDLSFTKDGASSEGDATIAIISGGTTETLKHGDILTIAGVNNVNPISGQSTGNLRQLVVDEDATLSAGDISALKVTPGTSPYQIYSAGAAEKFLPYQTVSALPANAAVVTFAGDASLAHKVNLAFHKDCLGLAMVPLEMPVSVSWKGQESYNGFTVRVIRDYDVQNDQEYIRFDVLFGVKTLNPFLGCRIAG